MIEDNGASAEIMALREGDARNVGLIARAVIGGFLLAVVLLVYRLVRAARRGAWLQAAVVGLVLAAVVVAAPGLLRAGLFDRLSGQLNPVFSLSDVPASVSARAQALFDSALVADMHADTLLWTRSLLADEQYGHVDVPRLLRGNVALQGFGIVTRVPGKMSMEANDEPSLVQDPVLLLALFGQWGVDALTSLPSRCLAQCAKLHRFAADSGGRLRVVAYREQLQRYLTERATADDAITAGYLGIEGLQALGGDVANLEAFFDAGVRTVGLAHFYDNDVAGSAHGRRQGGLTELGVRVVHRMAELGMFVDVAHLSARAIADVCAINDAAAVPRPIVASHAGVRGVCNNSRNLDDDALRCIARSGGVVGVAFFHPAICGRDDLAAIVDTIAYVRDLVGIDHVAFGSDFDGSVATPFDVSQLALVVDRMLAAGFTDDQVKKVVGGNLINMFLHHLPSEIHS